MIGVLPFQAPAAEITVLSGGAVEPGKFLAGPTGKPLFVAAGID
jgi:hypothetical protein